MTNVHEEFVDKFTQFMNDNAEKFETRAEAIKAFSGVYRLSQGATTEEANDVLKEEFKSNEIKEETKVDHHLFEGISSQYVDPLFEEGLKTKSDFLNVTKKEVLNIDGVGPATVKKLEANGVKFK